MLKVINKTVFTLNVVKLSVLMGATTFSITTLSIMIFGKTTLSLMDLFVTLSIIDT